MILCIIVSTWSFLDTRRRRKRGEATRVVQSTWALQALNLTATRSIYIDAIWWAIGHHDSWNIFCCLKPSLCIFPRRNQTLFLAKLLLSVNRLCLGERKMKGTAQVEEVSQPFTDSWNLQNYLHFLDVPRILSDFSSVQKLHVLRSLCKLFFKRQQYIF